MFGYLLVVCIISIDENSHSSFLKLVETRLSFLLREPFLSIDKIAFFKFIEISNF